MGGVGPGFGGRFANKLLVLLDGRSLYNPAFSGVYWDVQDTMLEDIERIEVIRGPGATLWGSNAINGVINIITKSAQDTQGGLVSVLVGNQEKGTVALRYGDTLGDVGHYRVYGKALYRDGNPLRGSGDDAEDDTAQRRVGFRADFDLAGGDKLTVQGDAYDGLSETTAGSASLAPPYLSIGHERQDVDGGNLLLRWSSLLDEDLNLKAQAYYDYTHRTWSVADETRNSLDLDVQIQDTRFASHDILYGLRYFYTADRFSGSSTVSVRQEEVRDDLFSAFIQDDIRLVPDRWVLTLGSKFEHNPYSDFVAQPNVRLLWTPDSQQSLWASAARSVRSPSRGERNAALTRYVDPSQSPVPLPLPVFATLNGDERFDEEHVMSYELGYRWRQGPTLSLDAALFVNRYDSLRTFSAFEVSCIPSGQLPFCLSNNPTGLSANAFFENKMEAETRGLELVVDWRPAAHWRLIGAYSYLHLDLFGSDADNEGFEDDSPRHTLSLRSQWDIRPDLQLDAWVRHVSGLSRLEVSDYTALDLRLGWRVNKQWELELVGQNLLDPRKSEFVSELEDIPAIEIERSVFVRGQYRF